MEAYLGIDVGSVTTKFAVLDRNDELITSLYLLTQGNPKPLLTIASSFKKALLAAFDDILALQQGMGFPLHSVDQAKKLLQEAAANHGR